VPRAAKALVAERILDAAAPLLETQPAPAGGA
jgi:hypothetical protein